MCVLYRSKDFHNSIGSNVDRALDVMLFKSGVASLLLLLLLLLSPDVLGIGVGVSLVGRIRRCLFGGSHRTTAMEGLSLKEKNQTNVAALEKRYKYIYYIYIFLRFLFFPLNIEHCIFVMSINGNLCLQFRQKSRWQNRFLLYSLEFL